MWSASLRTYTAVALHKASTGRPIAGPPRRPLARIVLEVRDGIIYATFCALGFAAVENISYYARSEAHNALAATFFVRGILAPWGHPLYTSMTGIGFGLSRESTGADSSSPCGATGPDSRS